MRKLFMLMVAALALTSWSFAQDQSTTSQDKDDAAKQDMKHAGHDAKDAAKATGRGVKNGAKWTKDKVTGDDNDKDRDNRVPQADRDRDADRDHAERDHAAAQDHDRDADHDRDRDANENRYANRNPSSGYSANSVHITNGPNVNPSSNSANINWSTSGNAATDVWLTGGGIRGHRTQYERGGSRNHSVTFSNLRPNTTYTYEIRTRNGGDRKQGTFTTR